MIKSRLGRAWARDRLFTGKDGGFDSHRARSGNSAGNPLAVVTLSRLTEYLYDTNGLLGVPQSKT